jgi:Zn-dependent metalloprotease
MKTITQSLCCVIPPFMLSRIGNTADGRAGRAARATLAQMRELANEQARTLIHLADPTSPEPRRDRNIYDAQGRCVLPGTLVLTEHDLAGGDAEAREAYETLGAFWDFLYRVFGRNSIDGRGLPLVATVHYGTCFQNAMWNGRQIVYGDGDGRLFNRFTAAPEITGHEAMHGVVQFILGMGYTGETGAVNEHLADVFGSMFKDWLFERTAEESDWLIGAGLLKPGIRGRGIRSLAEPGTAYNDERLGRDPQPSHLRDYVETEEDNGGVHINSGIPNHAFYLVATAIGGPSWEVAGRIWYRTLVQGLPNEPNFHDLALGTADMAGELYGLGSVQQRTVAEAWAKVGIVLPLDEMIADDLIPGRRLTGVITRSRLRRLLPL